MRSQAFEEEVFWPTKSAANHDIARSPPSSAGIRSPDPAREDNLIVAEDYLARTTTMYRIIAVGRTCSVP
jgi:hypothetical protein